MNEYHNDSKKCNDLCCRLNIVCIIHFTCTCEQPFAFNMLFGEYFRFKYIALTAIRLSEIHTNSLYLIELENKYYIS